jgi:PAS domain S-box-containing protein
MPDLFTTGSIVQFVTAAAAITLIGILWKNRKSNEVLFMILIELSVALWAFFYACEFSTPILSSKVIWSQLSYLGIAFLPVNYFFFTLAFGQFSKYVKLRNYLIASIIPVATIVMVVTDPLHHLVWKSIRLPAGSHIIQYVHGPWFWFFWGYAFFLIILSIIYLTRLYFRFGKERHFQVTLVILASLVPIFGNLAYVTGINPFPGFDWTTSGFIVTGILITIGMYRHHMFEIMPLATQKLIGTLNDGVIVINAKGLIEDMNPASRRIFSLNGKPVIKEPVSDVLKNHESIVEMIDRAEDGFYNFDLVRDEETHHYLLKVQPIHNDKKQLTGKLVIINDISSIRKSELQLIDRNQQLIKEIERNETLIADLDSFAHTVAHELKNLMGSIHMASSTLIASIEDKDYDTVKELSVLVGDAALKSVKVTDELMKLAMAGNNEIEKEVVDMQQIFEQAQQQLKDQIAEKGALIMFKNKLKKIKSYGPWLIEVWINYLGNAIKYGGTPPVITVGCNTLTDGRVKFWIQDNGDGIAPELQNSLFQKHTRYQPSKALGYGLGLSIVKQIIEKLNGTVGVESSGLAGEGAKFFFILPAN